MNLLLIVLLLHNLLRMSVARPGEVLDKRPCEQLAGTEDESFLKKNLLHLHSDPIAFFQHEIPRECNLEFIDIAKIEPPEGSQFFWIMYLGDTVSYDLYAAAVQRLTGYNPAANAEEVPLTRLGKHLGPQEDIRHEDVLGSVKSGPEYLVCCRANYHPLGAGNMEGQDSCVMGINSKASFLKREDLKSAKFYLFDDISEYIHDVIELLYMGSYKCISYMWAEDFYEASLAINKFNKADKFPSAVIMNTGIHMYSRQSKVLDRHLKAIIKSTDETPLEHETKYFLHSCSSTLHHKNGTNEKILSFNEHVKAFVPKWSSLSLYLDFWNYDVALSSVSGCKRKDGIHFERVCNYQPMITQWDFNWLLYFKIITIKEQK